MSAMADQYLNINVIPVWTARGVRYRDLKTGRFISQYAIGIVEEG